jgi:hypothetical protein
MRGMAAIHTTSETGANDAAPASPGTAHVMAGPLAFLHGISAGRPAGTFSA